MNALKDIIQRCHKRHSALLRQRKTIVTPALYKSNPYHFKVHCARSTPVSLDALELSGISFMPIGHAPENDRGPRDFGGDRFLKRQGTQDWRYRRWHASWGIQIYTGIPSAHEGANWHDFYFKYEAISAEPDAVVACIEALVRTTASPLLILTQSGGLRFSCRIPGYLHPNTDASRFYTYAHTPTPEDPHHCNIYLEIRGAAGYSRWDSRYEILLGNLLNPPVIAKEVLFTPIETFRAALHEPTPSGTVSLQTISETATAAQSSLGSNDLDLAKVAFLKRGFSYLRQDIGFHHWIRRNSDGDDTYLSLWEDQGVVWVRSLTPNTEVPTRAVPITDVWDDTGITSPISPTGVLLTDRVSAVREGKLSPLAIKRPPPMLEQQPSIERVYQTLEEHTAQVRGVYGKETRVLSIATETVPGKNYEAEAYLIAGGSTCLNIPNRTLAELAERQYQEQNVPSFARWRARMYRWEQVKDIPVEIRMANPFQHGNPCEDPERCRILERKGGDPEESICPKCPVYTECQERGYLSQPLTLRNVKAQISPINQLFFDPGREKPLEKILDPVYGPKRICIIDKTRVEVEDLFIGCRLRKYVLNEWVVNWRGSVLGNFANALLNAIDTESETNGSAIARVRAVVEAFQEQEADIITQMCQVNVHGKIVARERVDTETGEALAHFAIVFDDSAFAYIPVDAHAEDRLRNNGVPCFALESFTPNKDIQIPLSMTQAIAFGILDPETVEKIREFPPVCANPNWTYWHQLKHFFAHYTRDADAPMRWGDVALNFWIPPVLHPRIKHLLITSPALSQRHLRRAFPSEEVEVIQTKPIAWMPGNQVFQIRTDVYSPETLLNYASNWDTLSLSKIGERFFYGIRAEIDRDPSVKHAVITNNPLIDELTDIREKENVCFLGHFKGIDRIDADFEDVQVVWIIGTPSWEESTVWWQAQMLFGNDKKPLYYEREIESNHYKDERIQELYQQNIVCLLKRTVEKFGLSCWTDKKVVLITGLELPDITDRPETLLFDWEDFEVAGGLDKLPEVIATRERFEAERENLTAESSRQEVERILGCSSRKANRVLQTLRGGNIPRVSFQEQILTLLADGEKKASQLVAAIGSSPQSVGNELKRLVDIGEIVKVKRGVYALSENHPTR